MVSLVGNFYSNIKEFFNYFINADINHKLHFLCALAVLLALLCALLFTFTLFIVGLLADGNFSDINKCKD